MSVCNKVTLALLDKFLANIFVSNKVNFQNWFTNKLIRWFVFEAVKKKTRLSKSTNITKSTNKRPLFNLLRRNNRRLNCWQKAYTRPPCRKKNPTKLIFNVVVIIYHHLFNS